MPMAATSKQGSTTNHAQKNARSHRTGSDTTRLWQHGLARAETGSLLVVQAHDPNSTVLYRKIRVKVLPD